MAFDYDEARKQRDLDIIIGGQKFTIRLVSLTTYDDWGEKEIKASEGGLREISEMRITAIAEAFDDGNGAAERWTEYARSENGPSQGELFDLYRRIIQAQTDFPTPQPSPSTGGRGKTASTSKAA